MARALCLGELLVDMVSDADAGLAEAPGFLKAPGGAPANVAVGLARLGVDTGTMTPPEFGKLLRADWDLAGTLVKVSGARIE